MRLDTKTLRIHILVAELGAPEADLDAKLQRPKLVNGSFGAVVTEITAR